MIKKFLGLIALIVLINFSTASAAQIESVTDDAGVLEFTEVELLNQRILEIEQAHKIKIGVAIVQSVGDSDMVRVSNDFLDQYFNNGMNGGIVLVVAMDKRKYEMSTDRRMINIITDEDGIPFLKDKFQSKLSAGDYYGAVNNFIDGVDELLTYYETNGTPYSNATTASEGIDTVAAVGAVILSIFIGVIIRSKLIGSMSNVHHEMAAIDYLQKNTVKLTENRDTFLFTNVQRRPKSGGSRGGRGGHGGGGHGGGGGSF